MRDLEIRGAGNLLGAEQHGHMEAVGYDLYCKMLSTAVKEAKGLKTEEDFETSIDLALDAFIPPGYIPNESQKLDIYKRIAGIENGEEAEDMLEELLDRFGEPPKSVQNLLAVAELKALAHKAYITEIKQTGDLIRMTLYEKSRLQAEGIPAPAEAVRKRSQLQAGDQSLFSAEIPAAKAGKDHRPGPGQRIRGSPLPVRGGITRERPEGL